MLSPVARYILIAHALALGLGYLLGPPQWYIRTTFPVVRSLSVSVPAWGIAFIVAGLVLAAPHNSLRLGKPTQGRADARSARQ